MIKLFNNLLKKVFQGGMMTTLLNDQQLIKYIKHKKKPLIENLNFKKLYDLYDKESPIQSSSVDLHIGQIFNPKACESDNENNLDPTYEIILNEGQTAVILTEENLNFPNNISAIAFPPSRVSFKGLLMTNPGHIDPGYEGKMRFTVINMRKEPMCLRRGDEIVTVIFFLLSNPVNKDWVERGNLPSYDLSEKQKKHVKKLSSDFLGFSERAKQISKDVVEQSALKLKKWKIIGSIAVALIGVFGFYQNCTSTINSNRIDLVNEKIKLLKERPNLEEINKKVNEIEKKLNEIKEEEKNN